MQYAVETKNLGSTHMLNKKETKADVSIKAVLHDL